MKKLLLIFIGFSVAACKLQPDADELLNDMVVLTNYDQSVNFGNFATYTMPLDSIGLITNDGKLEWIGAREYSPTSKVTSAVRQNLSSTGRTRVGKGQSPHLAVNVYIVRDVRLFQSVVYPNYYGYSGFGGYYGYPGYYNYPQVVNYQSQTTIMVIELVDLVNVDPATGQTRVIWTANIGDIVQSFDPERKVVEAIHQAFAQSEYLNR